MNHKSLDSMLKLIIIINCGRQERHTKDHLPSDSLMTTDTVKPEWGGGVV